MVGRQPDQRADVARVHPQRLLTRLQARRIYFGALTEPRRFALHRQVFGVKAGRAGQQRSTAVGQDQFGIQRIGQAHDDLVLGLHQVGALRVELVRP